MDFIDIKAARRNAFATGIVRGLASPFLIYSTLHMPAEARPQIQEVKNPAEKTDGLRGDWKRVGNELKQAAKRSSPAVKHG